MKNIIIILLLGLIVFLGCKNESSDIFDKHQSIRKAELSTGKETNQFFLGFEFNDNIQEYRRKLDSLNRVDKIDAYRYTEGRDTIDDVKYEFKQISKLNGIDFLVHPSRHNDSLKGILLSATDRRMWKNNYNSNEILFEALLEEYKLKYGEPNFRPRPYSVFWINGNLEINIDISEPKSISGIKVEPSLSVSYENIKKEQELLDKRYRYVYILGFDTVDKWYQEEKDRKKKPISDI